MKQFGRAIACVTMALALGLGATACGEEKNLVVQYTEGANTYVVNVVSGQPFRITEIPTKVGHDFNGLFTAKQGGQQIVDETGSSLAAFKGDTSLVLFPQYTPKEYTFVLEYGESKANGELYVKATYGEMLPTLPDSPFAEHKTFEGWFTEPDCGGTQVSNEMGLALPKKSVVNETNFTLPTADDYITLYAGFKPVPCSVTLHHGENFSVERVNVPYGTYAKDIRTDVRNAQGYAAYAWSTREGGSEFLGKITGETTLYAIDWAPVLTFDANGGTFDKTDLIAKANTQLTLSTPTKQYCKFIGWKKADGTYLAQTMPTESCTVTAEWQPLLVLDENGGEAVDDVSLSAGAALSLKPTTREGYVFAGWYRADGTRFDEKVMPEVGLSLKAGWYQAKTEKLVAVEEGKEIDSPYSYSSGDVNGPKENWRSEIDLRSYLPAEGGTVTVNVHFSARTGDSTYDVGIYLYDEMVVTPSNHLAYHVKNMCSETYKEFEFTATFEMQGQYLYLCYYNKKTRSDGWSTKSYFSNVYVELIYPDTSNLIL